MQNNNNQASNNIEISESISVRERTRFFEALEEHKRETKKDIDKIDNKFEKHKDETKQEINKVEERLKKQNEEVKEELKLLKARQTAFSQRQNIFDLRQNTQDNKILFLSQQIESIKNEMSRFGQQAARSINPNEIIPEPYPGEEEFLKGIVAGKLPELELELQDIKRKCISGMFDAGVDAALSVYKFKNEYDLKREEWKYNLKNNDKEMLTESFSESFGKEILSSFATTAVNSAEDPKKALSILVAKCLILGGKYCYVSYKKHVADSHLQEFWEDEIKSYERKIKGYLKESNNDYFDSMVDKYNRTYDYNYGRDGVSIDKDENWFNSNAPQYKRKFNNIPGYIENIEEYTDVSERIHNSIANGYINQFDQNIYLKDDLTEDQKKDFECRFKTYKAVKKYGEFSDQSHCGDTLTTVHVIAGAVATFAFIFPGIIYALGSGSARIAKKIIWMNNKSRLKDEVLLKCMNGFNEKALEELIKIRNAISIIEHYVAFSESPFAKKFLEKCQKKQYLGVHPEKKKLFDTAFDLYQKVTNTGIANEKNYLQYNFVTTLLQDTDDLGVSKIFSKNIKKMEKVLEKLQNPKPEETTKVEIDDQGRKKTTKTIKRQMFSKEITEKIVTGFDGKITTEVEEKSKKIDVSIIEGILQNINQGVEVFV